MAKFNLNKAKKAGAANKARKTAGQAMAAAQQPFQPSGMSRPVGGSVRVKPEFAGIRKILQGQIKPTTPSLMQPPGKPLGQAQPLQANSALAAAAQLNQSPMSPPPGKELGQALPPVKPTLSPNATGGLINNLNSTGGGLGLANQIQNNKSPELLASLGTPPASIAAQRMQNNPMSPPPGKVIGQAIPSSPAAPSSPAVPAPTIIGPAQQMQAQKDQMFPPAPATPAAPVAPAPVTPPVAPKPTQVTPPAGVTKSQAEIAAEKLKAAPPKLDLGKIKFGGSF